MSNDNISIANLIYSNSVQKRFRDLLGNNASSFLSTVLSIANSKNIKECSAQSILSAAATAAALKLPISPSLGLAYIVPYKNGTNCEAQFQIGWRGYVQLAIRTNLYKTINSSTVYEGQIKDIDFITGKIIPGDKISDKVVGFVAYIELINGFNKYLFMSIDEMINHAKKYSKAYSFDLKNNKKTSVWSTNFNAMAQKTVLKSLLSHYGVISIDDNSDLVTALKADSAVINDDNSFNYVDSNTFDNLEVVAPDSNSSINGSINSVKDNSEINTDHLQPLPSLDFN